MPFCLFWSVSFFISGWHNRKSERCILPVWTLVNRLEAWENVKARLWSELWSSDSFSLWLWVHVCLCVCACVYERERERDVALVCGVLYVADAAIFISHSWRPRKCSVNWLTVTFSVSAWHRCADNHCHVAHAATCRLVRGNWGDAEALPNSAHVAHALFSSLIAF